MIIGAHLLACRSVDNHSEHLDLCGADWSTVDGAEVSTAAGFSATELGAFLAGPHTVDVLWSQDAIVVGTSPSVVVTFDVNEGGAEVGEIGPADMACPAGWTLRAPVLGTVESEGLLEPSDLEGQVWAWSLSPGGVRVALEGEPVLDSIARPSLVSAAQDAVGDGATLSAWTVMFMGTFEAGSTGVAFEFARPDGTSGGAALAQGRWGIP